MNPTTIYRVKRNADAFITEFLKAHPLTVSRDELKLKTRELSITEVLEIVGLGKTKKKGVEDWLAKNRRTRFNPGFCPNKKTV